MGMVDNVAESLFQTRMFAGFALVVVCRTGTSLVEFRLASWKLFASQRASEKQSRMSSWKAPALRQVLRAGDLEQGVSECGTQDT